MSVEGPSDRSRDLWSDIDWPIPDDSLPKIAPGSANELTKVDQPFDWSNVWLSENPATMVGASKLNG